MTFYGPFVLKMNDREYDSHQDKCREMSTILSKVIDRLMHYIFEGRCENTDDWESLFTVVQQAVVIKQYLDNNTANLITISEDLYSQAQEWEKEVKSRLK